MDVDFKLSRFWSWIWTRFTNIRCTTGRPCRSTTKNTEGTWTRMRYFPPFVRPTQKIFRAPATPLRKLQLWNKTAPLWFWLSLSAFSHSFWSGFGSIGGTSRGSWKRIWDSKSIKWSVNISLFMKVGRRKKIDIIKITYCSYSLYLNLFNLKLLLILLFQTSLFLVGFLASLFFDILQTENLVYKVILYLIWLRVYILEDFAFIQLRIETIVNRFLHYAVLLNEFVIQNSIEWIYFFAIGFWIWFLGRKVPNCLINCPVVYIYAFTFELVD
jgi:hypothetical protein